MPDHNILRILNLPFFFFFFSRPYCNELLPIGEFMKRMVSILQSRKLVPDASKKMRSVECFGRFRAILGTQLCKHEKNVSVKRYLFASWKVFKFLVYLFINQSGPPRKFVFSRLKANTLMGVLPEYSN